MSLNDKSIFYSKEALTSGQIYDILKKNNELHFEKLTNLVDLKTYSKKLSEKSVNFSIFYGSDLVGFSGCYFDDSNKDKAYISIISILKDFQGVGLGSNLIQQIINYGKLKTFNEIIIKPKCNNYGLIKFLEKNNFKFLNQSDLCCIFSYEL